MTCAETLEAMLEADPSELRVNAATPLGVHLRECPGCQSAARRIGRDTTMLAAIRRRRSRRRSLASRSAAAAFLAAAIYGVVSLSTMPGMSRRTVALNGIVVAGWSARSATPDSAPRLPLPSAATRVRVPRQSAPPVVGRRVVATPVRPTQLAGAVRERPHATLALRLDESRVDSLGVGVRVDPDDGKRATIMRTANAAITVVWLQD